MTFTELRKLIGDVVITLENIDENNFADRQRLTDQMNLLTMTWLRTQPRKGLELLIEAEKKFGKMN